MAKNRSQSAERRARQAELEAKQKKKERILAWSFGAGGAALVIGVALAIFLIVWLPTRPVYVNLNVTYTDANGVEQTGDILLELDPSEAPITVKNFKTLVEEGFYDGLTFHRVVENFMIQGGSTDGLGYEGSDTTITGEFASNGITNNIKHVRGTISMARADDPNSASSQFFIVHKTSASNTQSLDGNYAAFGWVIEGMEHVDAIAEMETNDKDKPLGTAKINSATIVK